MRLEDHGIDMEYLLEDLDALIGVEARRRKNVGFGSRHLACGRSVVVMTALG
jgi:hypothetical protein